MNITEEEKEVLLSSARKSIRAAFKNQPVPAIDYSKYPNLKINSGAFVTLTINGKLRGCIGYIVSDKPLFETVCESARHAAFEDPRFLPLTPEEFEKVKIEISVLSIPQPISSYDEIIIGRHGLILDEIPRAVLLPQVAVENNFNREQFLTAICEKAGIDPMTWRQRRLNLQVFTADIFSEKRKEEGVL